MTADRTVLEGKTALVTGATGTVGSRLVARLLEEGVRVRALSRRASPSPELEGAEPVRGDVTDQDAVMRAAQGADFVLHAAGYIGGLEPDWETASAVNAEGTRHVVRAARAAGCDRLVHYSTNAVYDARGRDVIDESVPILERSGHAYAHTKAEAERIVWRAAEAGLPLTVFRLGAVLGVHPSSIWGRAVVDWTRAGNNAGYHPDDAMPWVHADNLAEMTVLALRSPAARGEAYAAVDGVFRLRDLVGPIARWLDVPYPPVPDREGRGRVWSRSKLESLGYRPRVTFDDALREIEELIRTAYG